MRKLSQEILTEEQKALAQEWYPYAVNLAEMWAYKKRYMWAMNELISIAGLTVSRCIFRFSKGEASFKTYLVTALLRNFKYTIMLTMGFKLVGKRAEWVNPFDDVENFIFDEFMCEDRTNATERIDFEGILNTSKMLKKIDKKMLYCLYVEDMSMADAARELGCTREYIRQRKGIVLGLLKRAILADGGR